jgi:hypothetical protein
MNTVIIAICTFSAGLIIGSTLFAVCNTKAFEFQDNPTTRFNQLMQQQEQKQMQQDLDRQRFQQLRKDPC